MRQVFLDCDGVLADFDAAAEVILGMPPRLFEDTHGSEEFWRLLEASPRFYATLPRMRDADQLVQGCRDLGIMPVILTGCPRGGWAEEQKEHWRDAHYPGYKMICCLSAQKRVHAQPGDVLIDDWPKYRHLWEEIGGIFILHTSARESLGELQKIFEPD
jgi:hypothetical protein